MPNQPVQPGGNRPAQPVDNAKAKNKNEIPDVAYYNKLRAHLRANGTASDKLDEVLDTGVNGRSRKQMADQIISWLKSRPKE